MKHILFATTFICLFLTTLTCFAQDDKPDIDEWQTLKAIASRDPFANTNQFSINFPQYAATDWCYPLPGAKVISAFGGGRHHAGTDLKTHAGDSIRAVFAGKVIVSGPHYGYGNCVILRHANGLETLYSHNKVNLCKVGDWVQAGQIIGTTGRTGRASTEHLHFETRVNGMVFDSSRLFDHKAHSLIIRKFTFTKKGSRLVITSE